MLHIFIDADACPVKQEVYRVAKRCGLQVTLVANAWMRIPAGDWLRLEVVGNDLDAADDWIVDRVETEDIVITADIPLAAEVIEKQAQALSPRGELFTPDNIRERLNMRDFMDTMRSSGLTSGGPPPLSATDRQAFANGLDTYLARYTAT